MTEHGVERSRSPAFGIRRALAQNQRFFVLIDRCAVIGGNVAP
jgi:hypothetical protein